MCMTQAELTYPIEELEGASVLPGEPLLIMGTATAGKTTIGRILVASGVADIALEMDDFATYLNGKDANRLGRETGYGKEWDNLERTRGRAMAYAALALIKAGFRVIISGVWPSAHFEEMAKRLQDYQVLGVLRRDRDEAREFWIKRGGDGTRFDQVFDPVRWKENVTRFETFFRKKADRLVSAEDFLKWCEAAEEHGIRRFNFYSKGHPLEGKSLTLDGVEVVVKEALV